MSRANSAYSLKIKFGVINISTFDGLKMNEQSISLHRHELHKLVWSEPIARLAKQYGLSDVGLAKICKRYNIPRPGRGYWARKQAGEKVSITRLSKQTENPLIRIRIYPANPSKDKTPRSNLPVQVPKNICVPDELNNPHPLVIKTASTLESAKTDDTGILTPPKKECLDVRVSRECVDRALRIMDTLVKALLALGFTVSVSQGSTIVCIGDVSIGISLREETKRRRLRATEHDLDGYYRFGYNLYSDRAVPSGVLFLMIDDKEVRYHMASRRTWRDSETKRLEDCMRSFIYGLIKAANIKSNLNQKETESNQASAHSSEDEASENV